MRRKGPEDNDQGSFKIEFLPRREDGLGGALSPDELLCTGEDPSVQPTISVHSDSMASVGGDVNLVHDGGHQRKKPWNPHLLLLLLLLRL